MLGRREPRSAESLTDNAVSIEINLPIVIIVDIWAHRQNRPRQVKLQDLHIWGGIGQDVGNLSQPFFQKSDGLLVVHPMVQLGLEVNAAIGVGSEILDVSGKDLAVSHIRCGCCPGCQWS
jgi:hypothetical protein